MSRRLGILFLSGAAVLSLAVISGTAALPSITLDRTPTTLVSADPVAAISLAGVANHLYAVSENYVQSGTVANLSARALATSMTLSPNLTDACRVRNKQGKCTQDATWSLIYCLSTSTAAAGTRTCTAGTELTFTGIGPAQPASQSFGVSLMPNQTYYLLTRATIVNNTDSSTLCGSTALAVSGAGAGGFSVYLGHSEEVPRRFYLGWGAC